MDEDSFRNLWQGYLVPNTIQRSRKLVKDAVTECMTRQFPGFHIEVGASIIDDNHISTVVVISSANLVD